MKENSNIPQFQYAPFKYRVIHCYTPEVRKMERFATCNARNEKKYYQNEKLFEDREITSIGISLLQENQYTCLLYPNFDCYLARRNLHNNTVVCYDTDSLWTIF